MLILTLEPLTIFAPGEFWSPMQKPENARLDPTVILTAFQTYLCGSQTDYPDSNPHPNR